MFDQTNIRDQQKDVVEFPAWNTRFKNLEQVRAVVRT